MSEVWIYFEKSGKEFAKCLMCSQIVKTSNNTTNVKSHLKRKHSQQELNDFKKKRICNKNERKISDFMTREQEHDTEEASLSLDESFQSQRSDVNSSCSIKECFENINSIRGGTKETKIKNALLFFISKAHLPISIVENDGFLYFVRTLLPLYKPPSRRLVGDLLQAKYNEISSSLKETFGNMQSGSITLTFDIWTESLNIQSYLGITCHYVEDAQLKSSIIELELLDDSHTAAYLGERLEFILEKWHIKKDTVQAIVTDNGSNVVATVRNIFGDNKHIRCIAHSLHLITTKSIASVSELVKIIDKVKIIVRFFHKSVKAADLLRQAQENPVLHLLQEVSTRWNSTYLMLHRFIVLKDKVNNVLFNLIDAPQMLVQHEINVIEEAVLILKPFLEITEEVSGDKYVTLSKVIPSLNCAMNKFNSIQNLKTVEVKKLKLKLLDELKVRFSNLESKYIYAISTMLDPRFKKLHFLQPLNFVHAKEHLKKHVLKDCNIITDTDTHVSDKQTGAKTDDCSERYKEDSIWSVHNKLAETQNMNNEKGFQTSESLLNIQLNHYLNSSLISIADDPIKYWNQNKTYNILAPYALKICSTVASSVPSERLFSKASVIITKRRNRLCPEKLRTLLFLSAYSSEDWIKFL